MKSIHETKTGHQGSEHQLKRERRCVYVPGSRSEHSATFSLLPTQLHHTRTAALSTEDFLKIRKGQQLEAEQLEGV